MAEILETLERLGDRVFLLEYDFTLDFLDEAALSRQAEFSIEIGIYMSYSFHMFFPL
jgi:hypothetical protein